MEEFRKIKDFEMYEISNLGTYETPEIANLKVIEFLEKMKGGCNG